MIPANVRRWPDSASSVLEDAEDRFVQMASNFTMFNPHLTLSFDWDGKLSVKLPATNPGFKFPHNLDLAGHTG